MYEILNVFLDDEEVLSIPDILLKLSQHDIGNELRKIALNFIARKSEVSGVLFKSYERNGIKATWERLSEQDLLLAAEHLTTAVADAALGMSGVEKLKWVNAAHKLIGHAESQSSIYRSKGQYLRAQLDVTLNQIVSTFTPIEEFATPVRITPTSGLKTAPITLLFWEGPIARAYLATLRDCGYRPQRIINLVSDVDIFNGNSLARWLPTGIRNFYCKSVHQSRAHFWSRHIRQRHPELFFAIKTAVARDFGVREECYQECQSLLPLSEYCEDVSDLLIESLRDIRLLNALSKEKGAMLFTGGGIVPPPLLDLPNLNFLHIHPGKLPSFRGADCTLWSWLVTGRPSASLFYLASGIDDGEVVISQFLPDVRFDVDTAIYDQKTLYRAVYAFLDPWVRAFVLKQSVDSTSGLSIISSNKQDHAFSVNFHFMHDELLKLAFNRVFADVGCKMR